MTVTTIVVAMLADYALSRFGTRRGSRRPGSGLIAGQLVPSVLLIIPLSLTRQLPGLFSYWSMIITNTTLTVSLATLIPRGGSSRVSSEIGEAAKVDGCPA